MKKVVFPYELKRAEEELMRTGVTEVDLILRASTALYKKAITLCDDGKILVVAGKGNNGCDGLETARLLFENGKSVAVFSLGTGNEGNEKRIKMLKALGVEFVDKIENEYSLIIDCIFGIGLNRKAEGKYRDTITAINGASAIVLSADIPSGLNSETGEAYALTVEADYTLTFSQIKSGLLLGEGRSYAGEIEVAEIGIPCKEIGVIIDKEFARLPKRKIASHKGNYGRVAVIGGSDTLIGAPLMSFESAVASLRAGAGLVTLCVPEENKHAYQARVKETMLKFLPSQNGKILFDSRSLDEITSVSTVIAVGMGAGKSEEVAKTVLYLAKNFDGTLVIDADGLNSVCERLDELKEHKAKLILTPHIGEFNRLSKTDGNIVDRAKNLAKTLDCVLAVKSATTVITDGESVYFSVTGTPAMAKGGSGDLLAGIISAFSCVMPPLEATAKACYHFGKAGERAQNRLNSETSVLASDIVIELKD